MNVVAQDHLGGYVEGGDPATYLPGLWGWLVGRFDVESVLDVGCGSGVALDFFKTMGCEVLGVDGVAQDRPDVVQHDYTTGPYDPERLFDLAWCCEFVEHVEEKHIPNFMETLLHADVVLITHAFPGQPGHHHVNCQEPDYWIRRFWENGYEYAPAFTSAARRAAATNRFTWGDGEVNHFLRSGLVFVR